MQNDPFNQCIVGENYGASDMFLYVWKTHKKKTLLYLDSLVLQNCLPHVVWTIDTYTV